MHIHILGICGTFMGGLAALAKAMGHRVTGCDANVYPPMSTQLEALGIELIEGFAADQTALEPDLYVIGNVGKRGMPLIEEILNRNLPYTSGPQWLGDYLLRDKWTLAVAGTHGKTTTSSMLAWILEANGLQPGFLIGGIPNNFGISARLTESAFFVIEADEYDTAFFDKRSKFVHYRPRTAILNNLEYDHADIFPDLAAIETQFHHLVRTVPAQGRLVVNADAPALASTLARGCWSELAYFGQNTHPEQATWQIGTVTEGNAQSGTNESFDVLYGTDQGKEKLGTVTWTLNGTHNRLNALAAIAAAQHVGVRPTDAIQALSQFSNVKRRMETRGSVGGITVYDDFAHHPSAIATTLEGLRRRVGSKTGAQRILAVLEPRSNTMKLGVMKAQLPASLEAADLVFCYGEHLGWDAAEALVPLGNRAQVHQDFHQLIASIVQTARAGDHILVMSNGGFGGIHQKLLDALAASSLLATQFAK